jgi:hypothetical protein
MHIAQNSAAVMEKSDTVLKCTRNTKKSAEKLAEIVAGFKV